MLFAREKTESTQTNQKPNWQKAKFKSCFWFVFLLRVQIRESFSRETRYLFYTPHSTRAFLFGNTYTHKHLLKKYSQRKRDAFGKMWLRNRFTQAAIFFTGENVSTFRHQPHFKVQGGFWPAPNLCWFRSHQVRELRHCRGDSASLLDCCSWEPGQTKYEAAIELQGQQSFLSYSKRFKGVTRSQLQHAAPIQHYKRMVRRR